VLAYANSTQQARGGEPQMYNTGGDKVEIRARKIILNTSSKTVFVHLFVKVSVSADIESN
jgi:hypothetical protein